MGVSTETSLNPRSVRTAFKIVAIAEALSWAGLLIGMFFKWVVGSTEVGVQIFGPVHGGVFVAYVIVAFIAWQTFRWNFKTGAVALLSAIPPFATVFFEQWAERNDRLQIETAATA